MLEDLYMANTQLTNKAAVILFNILKDNNELKELYITLNNVTDDVSDAITTGLKKNNCLVTLYMDHNPLTYEAIVNIVNSLKGNYTLSLLGLPTCSEDIKKRINSVQQVVNEKRESQGCQVKLTINYL